MRCNISFSLCDTTEGSLGKTLTISRCKVLLASKVETSKVSIVSNLFFFCLAAHCRHSKRSFWGIYGIRIDCWDETSSSALSSKMPCSSLWKSMFVFLSNIHCSLLWSHDTFAMNHNCNWQHPTIVLNNAWMGNSLRLGICSVSTVNTPWFMFHQVSAFSCFWHLKCSRYQSVSCELILP